VELRYWFNSFISCFGGIRNKELLASYFILYTSYFQWLLAQWRVINDFYQNYHEISVFDSTDEIN